MKKFIAVVMCLFSLSMVNVNAAKSETKEKVNVYVFTKNGCGFCQKALQFLESLKEKYGKYYNVVEIEVFDAKWNADKEKEEILNYVAKARGDEFDGTPYIVIGNNYSFKGYNESFDEKIINAIKDSYNDDDYKDLVEEAKKQIKMNEPKDNEKSNDGIITVGLLALVVGGIVAFICLSRKKNK